MKKMMTIALCAIMMALCTTAVQAQENQKDMPRKRFSREQMAEAQAKHIAQELALDDATSKKFIETYQEYLKEVWANGPRHHRHQQGQPQAQPQEPQTEADAEKAIKERFEQQQKMLNLRETYYKKYSQFLTQKQIQRVYELEQQAMQRLHKRGGKHPHQRDGRPQRKL